MMLSWESLLFVICRTLAVSVRALEQSYFYWEIIYFVTEHFSVSSSIKMLANIFYAPVHECILSMIFSFVAFK